MPSQKYDLQRTGSILLRAATGLTIATEMLGLGVLFYLSTFTRYVADDFCEIVMIRRGPLLLEIYELYMSGSFRAANRFSKHFFIVLTELLGKYDVQLYPILMILLWLVALVWIISEMKKLLGIQQSIVVDIFMGTSLVFFSLIQASNLFQTVFWRSSSTVHFLPLVLFLLLDGFILFYIRSLHGKPPSWWACLLIFLVSFVIGGGGETPTVSMVVVHTLLLFYFWQRRGLEIRPALPLFLSALVGMFLALVALFLAPSNFSHGETSLLQFPIAIARSFEYTFEFIWDTLETLPIPSAASLILPGLLFFGLYTDPKQELLMSAQRRHVGIALLVLPLLSYLLIAASFTPSAYAQSFPIERTRITGRLFMTAALVFEGALLGVWFAQLKPIWDSRRLFFPVAAVLMFLCGLYPLRGGLALWNEVGEYRAWAAAWDARQQLIYNMAESGVQDPVVEWFPNRYGVKDIDGSTEHWMNKCVADYYGFSTIRSVPMGE